MLLEQFSSTTRDAVGHQYNAKHVKIAQCGDITEVGL
jgi:hypothetical protein